MAKEKTLNDIALNQVLSTDRLESAMENNTNKIIQAIEDIDTSGCSSELSPITGMPTSSSKNECLHYLMNMQLDLNMMKIGMVVGIVIMAFMMVLQAIFLWNVVTSVRSLENGTWVYGKYDEFLDTLDSNGSEQNTSTEGASSPQTTDQSNPESSSGEPLPQSSGPEVQESGQ